MPLQSAGLMALSVMPPEKWVGRIPAIRVSQGVTLNLIVDKKGS